MTSPDTEHTLPGRLSHIAGIYQQLGAEAWKHYDITSAIRHRAMAEAMLEAARIAEEWPRHNPGKS